MRIYNNCPIVINFFIFLIILLGTQLACAHPGHFGSSFHAHDLNKALEFAEQEYRLIFMHVREDGGKRLSMFRWPSDDNADLLDLLVRETVILEIDATEHADHIAQYNVNPPEILLLNPDGSELERLDGKAAQSVLAWKIKKALSGSDAVNRAKSNLKRKGENDYFSRERLAAAYRNAGMYEKAVEEYRWCASQCIAVSSLAARSRRSKTFIALADFASEQEIAKTLRDDVLNEAENVLLTYRDDSRLAQDLVQIYKRGNKIRAKKLFDRLDENSKARHGLLDYLFDDLVQDERYQEILKLIDPMEAFKGEVERYKRNQILKPATAENGYERGTKSFIIKRSSGLVQALAGTGDDVKTRQLIKKVLDFDRGEASKGKLMRSLNKVGRIDLLQEQ